MERCATCASYDSKHGVCDKVKDGTEGFAVDNSPLHVYPEFGCVLHSSKAHMGFGAALEILKDGKQVQRAGWNGRGMWLELVPAEKWWTSIGPSAATVLPWIGMKTADGGFVPWLASQTDLLAEDWSVVP